MKDDEKSREQLIEELTGAREELTALRSGKKDPQSDLIYEALLHAPCGTVVASTSAAGEILFINHDFTAITGYTHDDVPTVAAWIERAYPDLEYRAMVVGNWERDISEPGRNVVYRVACKDGVSKEILLRAALLPDERMMVTLLDVSERLRWERALRESEERFRRLAETVDQVFWMVQPEPVAILYASPAFEEIWGRPVEDLYADADVWSDCILPEDRHEVSAEWAACIKGETTAVHFNYRIRRPDGTVRWIADTGAAVLDDDGRMLRINGVAKDITAPKQAEQALRESEERYRALVDTMPTGVAVHSGGYVRYANRTLLEFMGIAALEDVVDRPVLGFVHPDDHEETRRRIRSLLGGGTIDWGEVRFLRPGSDPLVVETFGSLIEWYGEPAVQLVITDITARKHAEQERQELSERVQHAQKLESLGILAGGVAHDFNNLLVGILGNADLALMDLPPESTVRPNLEGIELAARRAADLARQMLAYSGRGRFVVERFDLRKLIEEIAHLMEASISKRVVIKYEFDDRVPAVEADSTQMRQVLMNLITNASEAIGERSGIISITTGVMDCDKTYLADTFLDDDLPAGTYSFVEVSDTGSGMDLETRKRIFDPFFSTKFTGRGLGLAAVLGIVKGHSGAVKVYSEKQKGTTFKVLLPAVEGAASLHTVAAEARPSEGQTGTILLVDDEETVRSVGAAMLRRSGYTVLTAEDGRAAVALFAERSDEIDVVVLDLAMPHMDGQETFRELRRLRADVRVLLSSGYNEQDAINRFAGKKLAGFIQKPYSSAAILEAVRSVLEG